jgi:hypothetical protein
MFPMTGHMGSNPRKTGQIDWYSICIQKYQNLEKTMAPWNGIADCPKCGNKGTLMVSGEASTLEIDGCWVCGFGREQGSSPTQFLPIKHLRIEKRLPSATSPGQ